jgi:hypothetical protein
MSLVTPFRNLASNLRCLSLSSSSWLKASQTEPTQPLKRPVSAYNQFVGARMEIMRKNNPNLKAAEIIKVVGKEWSSLPESKKRPYELIYQQKKVAYETAVEKLTDEQKDDIEQGKKQAKEAKQIRKLKKELLAMLADKPKFLTPYSLFVTQESKNQTGGFVEKSKGCAAKWKTMTDAQKQNYQLKSDSVASELQQCKNKIAEEGRDVKILALKRQIAELKE